MGFNQKPQIRPSQYLCAVYVQVKLVINFVYLLVGMAVVAMCYYLLREEVTVRVNNARQRMKEKCAKCKASVGGICCCC